MTRKDGKKRKRKEERIKWYKRGWENRKRGRNEERRKRNEGIKRVERVK